MIKIRSKVYFCTDAPDEIPPDAVTFCLCHGEAMKFWEEMAASPRAKTFGVRANGYVSFRGLKRPATKLGDEEVWYARQDGVARLAGGRVHVTFTPEWH